MTGHRVNSVALATLVLLATITGSIALTGTAVAAAGGAVDADPADPGANATHKTTVEVTDNEAGNSLSAILVNYSADAEFDGKVGNVTVENVKRVGIDMDEDGDIDREAEDLKEVKHPKEDVLLFDFGGDTDIDENESVIVVYNGTTNPTEAGNYTVSVDLNPQSTFDPVETTLQIGESVTDDQEGETYDTAYEPAANNDEIVDSAPPKPGISATHHVAIATSSNEVGNSLSNVVVNYHADGSYDGSVQDVGQNDVKQVGFDVDGDGDIEISTMDDLKEVSTSNVGETITFDFGGNYGIKDDYVVIVVFADSVNPSAAGNYTVEADVNTQSTRNPRTGSLVLANFTFRNFSVQNYTAESTNFTNTTVRNSTWRNATLTNSTVANTSQLATTWRNVTITETALNDTALANATWRNVTVENATWRNVTVRNGTWQNATQTNATVVNATWQGTNVTEIDWRNVTLVDATWTNSSVVNATWTNSSVVNATWTNSSVHNYTAENVTVGNVTWSGTNATETSWSNTSITNTSVKNSTLSNVSATNSTFTNVMFTNVTLSNVTFANVTVVNATLSNASWTNVTVTNSTFENATVTNASWQNTTVANVSWQNATVSDADWQNTTVTNSTWTATNFTDTDWTNATIAATFNDTVATNFTVVDSRWNATSGAWSTSWEDSTLRNATFNGVTFRNSTVVGTSFVDVNATEIHHVNVTLSTIRVANETLVTAELNDETYEHEQKYVHHIEDGDENEDS
ncbi:MAG: pentapeptide repeat-containing protein [Halopenitus sp.]